MSGYAWLLPGPLDSAGQGKYHKPAVFGHRNNRRGSLATPNRF